MPVIKIFFLIICFIFSSYNQTEAREAENIKIESLKSIKLVIKGYNKYIILNPSIAEIKVIEDGLLITGVTPGSTPLYIWKDEELIPYIITTSTNKSLIPLTKNGVINENDSYGYYGLTDLSRTELGNKSDIYQSFQHTFYYKTYLSDGGLSITGNFSNTLEKFNSLKEIRVDNFLLNYENSMLKAEIGDSNLNISSLANITNGFRGIKLTHKQNIDKEFSFFTGLDKQPFYLYGINPVKQKNSYLVGSSGFYSVNEKLTLMGNAIFEISPEYTGKSNLALGIRCNPFENIFINNDIASNFLGMANSTNIRHLHKWKSTKEWVETTAEYRFLPQNYLREYFDEQNFYSLNLKLFHRSNFLISLKTDSLKEDFNSRKNFSLNVSRNLNKYISMNGSFIHTNFNNGFYNNYQLGSNFNFLFPLTVSYSYISGEKDELFDIHQFTTYINLINFNKFNLFFNSITETKNTFINNGWLQAINTDFSLSGFFNINDSFNMNGNLVYRTNTEEVNNKKEQIALNLKGIYKLFPFHQFNFDLGFNNILGTKENSYSILNLSVGYTYYFGEAINKVYNVGEIKGVIFEDLNNNGAFDPEEKTFSNIRLTLDNKLSVKSNQIYKFDNLDYGNYEVSIDKNSIPTGYKVITPSPELVGLNGKIQEINFEFLKEC